MDETCQECGGTISRRAKANIWAGEKVVCTACLKTFQAAERRRLAAVQLAGVAGAPWLVHDGRQQHGPYPTSQLIELLRRGKVDWLWNIWREGMSTWKKAANLFTSAEFGNGRIELRDFGQGDGTYRPS